MKSRRRIALSQAREHHQNRNLRPAKWGSMVWLRSSNPRRECRLRVLGRVKTPTFNLRVEIPSRFRKFENQKCLRPPLREDDRENNSAHSWLGHVFTQPGSKAEKLNASICFPLCPHERTSPNTNAMSVSCRLCCKTLFAAWTQIFRALTKPNRRNTVPLRVNNSAARS